MMMNAAQDRFDLHAYVDGELAPDDAARCERMLADDPAARAEVDALRAQNAALHARYDALLAPPGGVSAPPWRRPRWSAVDGPGWAVAATVLLASGLGLGWLLHGAVGPPATVLARASADPVGPTGEGRLQAFVQTATRSHAVFAPEIRHPVEVGAADEAHLVAWLSKRLDAPLTVPHLGDAGWSLLGGRLLPSPDGPMAQFMYQDRGGRRLTLAVSRGVAPRAPAGSTSFRIAEENGSTVFYWLDADYAYALTGALPKAEMTVLASQVHRQLER